MHPSASPHTAAFDCAASELTMSFAGLLLFSAADRLLQQATSMKAADQAELSAAASATAAAAMRFDLAGVAMLSLSLTASGFISVVQQMVMQQRGLHRLHWRTFVCMGGSRSVQTQQLHAPGTTTSKRKNGECGYSEVEPSRLGPKDDLLFFQVRLLWGVIFL
eukprot:SAG31_NODE_374_length_16577_cov_9.902173_8_plen_163_part_00